MLRDLLDNTVYILETYKPNALTNSMNYDFLQ